MTIGDLSPITGVVRVYHGAITDCKLIRDFPGSIAMSANRSSKKHRGVQFNEHIALQWRRMYDCYSARSAFNGSTLAARPAGTALATNATVATPTTASK